MVATSPLGPRLQVLNHRAWPQAAYDPISTVTEALVVATELMALMV